jgi:protein-disulfide isomerase
MPITRRLLIAASAALPMAGLARAQTGGTQTGGDNTRMADRSMGPADAKVQVVEWFSLTCTHCAAFQRETFPQVRAKLIDTGRIRYTWRDYPLDQVALTAAMVARALPVERYEPFITALLASQDRWAFARGVNSTEELAKYAALAGMSRETFNGAIGDAGLKRAILTAQEEAEKKMGVKSTPSFIINGKLTPGAVPYGEFEKAVDAAAS